MVYYTYTTPSFFCFQPLVGTLCPFCMPYKLYWNLSFYGYNPKLQKNKKAEFPGIAINWEYLKKLYF